MNADAEALCGSLVQSQMLRYLGTHLINLTLRIHSHELPDINLDCLSSLSNMTSLQVKLNSKVDVDGQQNIWSTQGQLSLLTALQSFTFLEDGDVRGPLTAALASLPHLTQLTLSSSYRWRIHSMQFTTLKVFKLKDVSLDWGVHPLAIDMLSLRPPPQPQESFGFLTEIRIHKHVVFGGRPWPLCALPNLRTFKLKQCTIQPEDWLSQSLQGATQLLRLVLWECCLREAPSALSDLLSLTCLDMECNLLRELPASLTHLTNLEQVWLAHCAFLSVPIVLEQMTHLQYIAMGNHDVDEQASMQITRPLSFLTSFPELKVISMSSIWSAQSMFHIGAGQAAIEKAFKHRLPCDRPSFHF